MNDLLTTAQVCELLGVGESTFVALRREAGIALGPHQGYARVYPASVLPALERARDCRRARANHHGESYGPCQICGRELSTHLRCRSCTILVGPGHDEQLRDGYCSACHPDATVERGHYAYPREHGVRRGTLRLRGAGAGY